MKEDKRKVIVLHVVSCIKYSDGVTWQTSGYPPARSRS